MKAKLLNEVSYMQQSTVIIPRNDEDAKIIHHSCDELSNLNCKQLQVWIIVRARII